MEMEATEKQALLRLESIKLSRASSKMDTNTKPTAGSVGSGGQGVDQTAVTKKVDVDVGADKDLEAMEKPRTEEVDQATQISVPVDVPTPTQPNSQANNNQSSSSNHITKRSLFPAYVCLALGLCEIVFTVGLSFTLHYTLEWLSSFLVFSSILILGSAISLMWRCCNKNNVNSNDDRRLPIFVILGTGIFGVLVAIGSENWLGVFASLLTLGVFASLLTFSSICWIFTRRNNNNNNNNNNNRPFPACICLALGLCEIMFTVGLGQTLHGYSPWTGSPWLGSTWCISFVVFSGILTLGSVVWLIKRRCNKNSDNINDDRGLPIVVFLGSGLVGLVVAIGLFYARKFQLYDLGFGLWLFHAIVSSLLTLVSVVRLCSNITWLRPTRKRYNAIDKLPFFITMIGLGLGIIIVPALCRKWKIPIAIALPFALLSIPTIFGLIVLARICIKECADENLSATEDNPQVQEKYPSDTYSLIAVHCPSDDPKVFCFGLAVFFFQLSLLILMALNVAVPKLRATGDVDNTGTGKWWGTEIFPSNSNAIVRGTQIVSLVIYIFIPDSSLSDITTAFELFPPCHRYGVSTLHGADELKQQRKERNRLRFACILRFIQGLLSTLAVFVLVMTSSDVIDIVLNFTAVNFISELDNKAFELAEQGKYGKMLESAVNVITGEENEGKKGKDLPFCLTKQSKRRRYELGIILTSVLLYIITVGVMATQDSTDKWITKILRVEFEDEARKQYSGCYSVNPKELKMANGRYMYESNSNNAKAALIGYCSDERRWLIFDGSETDNPCDAYSDKKGKIAHSAKTDTFDIQSSITEEWYTPFNKPIVDMYFVQSENITELVATCGSFPSDGKCDEALNIPDYQYDGGDCCAATCVGEDCPEYWDDIYCEDPNITPLTLVIESKPPIDSILELECETPDQNTHRIFSVRSKQQTNWTEHAMLPIGWSCTLNLLSMNSSETGDDPLLSLSYSVFHGYKKDVTGNEALKFFEFNAMNLAAVKSFQVPSTPEYLSPEGSVIMTNLNFGTVNPVETQLDFFRRGLAGTIPSPELGVLRRLTSLDLSSNDLIGAIPSELGELTSLTYLSLSGNALTGTIPSELGVLRRLTSLDLCSNDLIGAIPSELGELTSLTYLSLCWNDLTGTIPSELGELTSLTYYDLSTPEYLSPEGSVIMTNLNFGTVNPVETQLDFFRRGLAGTIPSELGVLRRLTSLDLSFNDLNTQYYSCD